MGVILPILAIAAVGAAAGTVANAALVDKPDTPDIPSPPPIPPPPASLAPDVIEGEPAEARAAELRRARRGGRQSTILGGALSPDAVAVPGAVGQSRILGG